MGYKRLVAQAVIKACKSGVNVNSMVIAIAVAAVLYSFISALQPPATENIKVSITATLGDQTYNIQNASMTIMREPGQLTLQRLLVMLVPFVPVIQAIATYGLDPKHYGPVLLRILDLRVNKIPINEKTRGCRESLQKSLHRLKETLGKGQIDRRDIEDFIEDLEKCEKGGV